MARLARGGFADEETGEKRAVDLVELVCPARVAAPVISKGNGLSEHRSEDGDGEEFAGFCVHLRAQRTRHTVRSRGRCRIAHATAEQVSEPANQIKHLLARTLGEIAQVFVNELADRQNRSLLTREHIRSRRPAPLYEGLKSQAHRCGNREERQNEGISMRSFSSLKSPT